MDREEAIKQIREWDFLNDKELEAIQTLIPELNESEDESIRKSIIAYLSNELHNVKQLTPRTDEFEHWIAYLEKQEHIATEAYNKGFADGTVAERESEELEGQKEQTGKKWIYEDDYKSQLDAQYEQGLEDGRKEQKPAEWSEEDEEHLDSIIESYRDLLKDYSANNGVDYIPYNTPAVARTVLNDIKFLKSLRPQSKRNLPQIIAEVTKDKESATRFLKDAGIMDENGELAEMYRPEKPKTDNSNYDHLQSIIDYLRYKGHEDDADYIESLKK